MAATLAAIPAGYQSDWSHFDEGLGARAEFTLGETFLRANGKRDHSTVLYARWACITFSLIGANFAYRWARDLYESMSGLVTLVLYVFEPNLLAHGELITPGAACTAFRIVAGYTSWKWLQRPTRDRAALARAKQTTPTT